MPKLESVESLVKAAEAAVPFSQRVCGKAGSKLNAYKVELRSHEKKAMVFRYLVYKGLETAFMGMMTAGQVRGTQTDLPGFPSPVETPNLPVELTLRQGWELAIKGQVATSSWFFFAGDHDQLFYLDANRDVTAVYYPSTGETTQLERSSIGKFVDQKISEEQRSRRSWDDAYRSGRAL